MPLIKAHGNMYPWVDYLHTHMGGKCPHECKYCYVQTMHRSAIKAKYSGELRLYENEFKANYDKKGVYFIEHMNDLFARGVPTEMVKRILAHCNSWPDNKYIFQTKNPEVILDHEYIDFLPENSLIGTTVESDIDYNISKAPLIYERVFAMKDLTGNYGLDVFITIEPIMQFNLDILSKWIIQIKPEFVNIGADSKKSGLPEPAWNDIELLITVLKDNGIEVRQKSNLERLKNA